MSQNRAVRSLPFRVVFLYLVQTLHLLTKSNMWPLSQKLVELLGMATVSALPKTCHAPELPLPLRQVCQFPSFPTYLGNLYVRSNGDHLAVAAFLDA
ncbi:hypothetical protein BO86DRAFT_399448 [Aspergillus japonicus CBS 114.51]|uniref:Uncharacterized protein n=1 Tax=Aspergillus japonicus CBS 114.51 TaxID=1448312 RepID=A0A8T8X309_ASPJA|nr:hypothetical protein BO86DRAFT_399448 [Aspergillus japonicus CBS 114.51]RAH81919.1 hypothetical protein BO86DRAFT_399448 [Aspergillus japonicus CBS 114.51]